jgi:hypothetical protein
VGVGDGGRVAIAVGGAGRIGRGCAVAVFVTVGDTVLEAQACSISVAHPATTMQRPGCRITNNLMLGFAEIAQPDI